ncbi:MAG TPA: cysteine desulfurase-like protein [Gemmatimonadaceae bacterium]|jgi:cysteine desulfurase family protein (TIGR01976 family)|nr:cysteine desulfurase-like protein [Gemmatimonadaceae bacterium]
MSIREQFPALARCHNGRPVAYFDGPGGTQVPLAVGQAMTDYLYHHNANTDWAYPSSEETDAMIHAAREAAADLLNASPSEVVFGANMTTLTFHVARSLGRGWKAGDEVIVTDLDHQGNVAPWRAIERERGITIRVVPFDPATGELDLAAFGRLLSPRTRLVAIGAASNALGTVNDVAAIAKLARSAGALVFVDAVHYAPHAVIDVKAWGCDFLACSAYKFYGPHVGVLYGRRELLQDLDVPRLEPASNEAPERLETGTLNHEGIVGTRAAIDFLASLAETGATRRERLVDAMTRLDREGQTLVARLWNGLAQLPCVRLYGPPPGRPRTATLSFAYRHTLPRTVAERLAESAIFASSGDFYASTVIARVGHAPEGLVRAGCACYTTTEEVDRFIAAVAGLSRL